MADLLITAGPTHEAIDAVRYIANRSSGKLGAALAEAGRDAGWAVTLLLGPVALEPPAGVAVHPFTTTADLSLLLAEHFPACDVLVMAAAVADYRPARPAHGKLPRTHRKLVLELEPTPDLVAGCAAGRREDQLVIAFALEPSDQLDTRAAEKLRRKKVDAIIANPLATMTADTIDPTLLWADGRVLRPGAVGKKDFAHWLISQIGPPRSGSL